MISNQDFIKERITSNSGTTIPYLWTHGATKEHMGDGLIVYSTKASHIGHTYVHLNHFSITGIIASYLWVIKLDTPKISYFEIYSVCS